jgi:fucose 4-O-acetylase-like acetyltransferase
MNLNALKGILIILVIVDHNDLSRSLFAGFLYGFGFHVAGFLTIPFLKPAAPLDRDFAAYAFRLWYPFMVVASVMALLMALATHADGLQHLRAWAHALYSGNAVALKQATGMYLLWFLPSFVALAVLRGAFARGGAWMLVAAAVAVHPFIGSVAAQVQAYLPLGVLPALYVIPLGAAGAWLHQRWLARMPVGVALLLALAVFVPVKYLQMQAHLYNEVGFAEVADYTRPLALLLNDLECVAGVLALCQLCRLPMPRLLEACGRYSIQIYLFHAFVALAVFKAVQLLHLPTVAAFALSLATTVVLTLLLARALAGNRLAQRFLFPRSPAVLMGRAAAVPPAASLGKVQP